MEKYDYIKAVCDDINNWLLERFTYTELFAGDFDRDNIIDEMMLCDSVTGNASGSYTFSTWQAEENLCHNRPLLLATCDEFGDQSLTAASPECQDVCIRCMLLPYCYDAVIEGYKTSSPIDYYGIEQMLCV